MLSIDEAKRMAIVAMMKNLRSRLESNDDSELFAWSIRDHLAVGPRPLRHHPIYGGSGSVLPPTASDLLHLWVWQVREAGISSVISFMHARDLNCYGRLDLAGAADFNDYLEKQGVKVARIPWEDPHHSKSDPKAMSQLREHCCRASLAAYDVLPKPVLLQCSAGIDRSAPAGAYIWQERDG